MNTAFEPLEIVMRCNKKNKAIYTKYFVSDRERRQLINSIGDAAYMLFEYYLRMAAVGDQELTDSSAATYFGWSVQKAKRNRLALGRAGFFRSTKGKLRDGTKTVHYYIGEDAVADSLERSGKAPGVAQGAAAGSVESDPTKPWYNV